MPDVGAEEQEGSCVPAQTCILFSVQLQIFATVNTTALGVNHWLVYFCFISDFQGVMSEILCSAFQALRKLQNKRQFTG